MASFPLIALWAHPRSMSTATERIMRERGDLHVFHEPFLAYYYKHISKRALPLYDHTQAFSDDYVQIIQHLMNAANSMPVFFKDMSYYVYPRVMQDLAFCQRLHSVFLIRNPLRTLASYYRLDPEFESIEVGLESQWRHFEFLCEASDTVPLVIEAESIAAQPKVELRRIWQYCGLEFVDSAFSWQADQVPADWQYVQSWHTKALTSSAIQSDNTDPEQSYREALQAAPHLAQYLQHHLPYYERLKSVAKSQSTI